MHRRALVIDGDADKGFHFRHADGTAYGQPMKPPAVDVARQVFTALTRMGFRHTQARRLIDQVQQAGAPEELGEFERAALPCAG